MTPAIPAITIWQPWATLIAWQAKPFEFRSWRPARSLIGTRIAIHAGARTMPKEEVRALLVRLHSASWRETGLIRDLAIPLLERAKVDPDAFPRMAVVCTALLGEPLRNNEMAAALGLPLVNDSDRVEHTNWGWPLSEIERLEPYEPASGAQGFWTWLRSGA